MLETAQFDLFQREFNLLQLLADSYIVYRLGFEAARIDYYHFVVGKTSVGIELAILLGGEIVSADSRQIYRQLDIGTAKPTAKERERVKHHFIDELDLNESFSAGEFSILARQRNGEICARGLTPVVVGGSTLYVHALIESLRLDEAEEILHGIRMADQDAAYEQLRAQLETKREAAKSPEIEALEQQLAAAPDDLDVRYQLGVQYTDAGQFKDAMEHFITILRKEFDHGDGATKRLLLDTIASLGKGDPLAVEYQRKLYSLLY